MVNQAFRIKIAYRSEKKKKEEEENTRDRSVPDGSDKHIKQNTHNEEQQEQQQSELLVSSRLVNGK